MGSLRHPFVTCRVGTKLKGKHKQEEIHEEWRSDLSSSRFDSVITMLQNLIAQIDTEVYKKKRMVEPVDHLQPYCLSFVSVGIVTLSFRQTACRAFVSWSVFSWLQRVCLSWRVHLRCLAGKKRFISFLKLRLLHHTGVHRKKRKLLASVKPKIDEISRVSDKLPNRREIQTRR